ncbi:hypothetical protein P7K49_027903 [Saguinus oedipus]|uniref:Uncharacterized protein n=1 Tax=Saguinus oedipus TaxID=9490 RepID=A0ABQ9UBL6_SAGOE|nr:hypothetical protein P7K49_027903 [Saguinus oedipus]
MNELGKVSGFLELSIQEVSRLYEELCCVIDKKMSVPGTPWSCPCLQLTVWHDPLTTPSHGDAGIRNLGWSANETGGRSHLEKAAIEPELSPDKSGKLHVVSKLTHGSENQLLASLLRWLDSSSKQNFLGLMFMMAFPLYNIWMF